MEALGAIKCEPPEGFKGSSLKRLEEERCKLEKLRKLRLLELEMLELQRLQSQRAALASKSMTKQISPEGQLLGGQFGSVVLAG